MRSTVSASVRFVDQEDKPVANQAFRAHRGQRFFHSSWNSRDFRSRRSTAEEVLASRKGDVYHPIAGDMIVGKTDVQGIANIDQIHGQNS